MPWWATAYLVLFVVVSIAGIIDDRQNSASGAYVLWAALALIAAAVIVAVFFLGNIPTVAMGAAFAVSFSFEITSISRDIQIHRSESGGVLSAATAFSALLYAPVIVCAFLYIAGS